MNGFAGRPIPGNRGLAHVGDRDRYWWFLAHRERGTEHTHRRIGEVNRINLDDVGAGTAENNALGGADAMLTGFGIHDQAANGLGAAVNCDDVRP